MKFHKNLHSWCDKEIWTDRSYRLFTISGGLILKLLIEKITTYFDNLVPYYMMIHKYIGLSKHNS